MSWKLEQKANQDTWLRMTTALLRNRYGTAALEFQDELAAACEAIGDLKAHRPLVAKPLFHRASNYHTHTCSAKHLKAQLALIHALVKRVHVKLAIHVNLYLNLLPLDDCRNLAKVLNHPQG